MKDALSVMDMESEKLGDDWLMTGYLKGVN